jgi:HSP20 family protein
MAIVKRSQNLFPGIPSLFDDFLTRDLWDWRLGNIAERGASLPAVNIRETDNEFSVEVAAPGMKKDDFKIELDNNMLTISSEREHEEEHKEGEYCRREFSYSSFRRSFSLPEDAVNTEKINANYENGVLQIHLPKKEEAKPKPVRTIRIG